MAEWWTNLTLLITEKWTDFVKQFNIAFIEDDRWKYLADGLGNTLKLTALALLVGIGLGVIVAIVRSTWDRTEGELRPSFGKTVFRFFNWLCKLYITVIRGTPVVVQIMIIFFVIMASSNNKILAGVVAFGINSGAYVSEIVRGGIMSIDEGQFEAGRSLGLNYVQTMWRIILPQSVKNVLPALANEFITLLKETAVAGYVGMSDLTRGANIIRGITYQSFMPLVAAALIYLALVMFFTKLVGIMERRLRRGDR
ncbi:MAG: amino acid ABC transporter permease [Ruminococcaceae bacterium]|nr:amino acid ABC transporter permease [Oscillospiraceae bacterium]